MAAGSTERTSGYFGDQTRVNQKSPVVELCNSEERKKQEREEISYRDYVAMFL
jgi:hypothetical protein